MKREYPFIDTVDKLQEEIDRVKKAQAVYAGFTQEQVDRIFLAAATAANKARIPLAKAAVAETGMGIVEDKVIKNHFASEYIYNAYRNTKTCGVIEEDPAYGIRKIAEPLGLICAIIPTTNPTSTAIFKTLLALKTRNGIIISPHHRAKGCTVEAARLVLEAAVEAGAPEDIIGWIDMPSRDMTGLLMKQSDVILATGGPSMVTAAYSSGTPALGVGAGNTPAVIDESADILLAVNSIIHSKTFDNGMICASEQSVIVHTNVYDAVKREFAARGCYFLNPEETEKVRKTMLINGALNAKIVGQKPVTIAALAGFAVPEGTKILIGEVESVELSEEFAHEKLSTRETHRGRRSWSHLVDLPRPRYGAGKAGGVPGAYEDLPHCGKHPLFSGRSGRPLQFRPHALADAGLRLLGRQLRVGKCGRQASAEHQNRCGKKGEHAVVPCAGKGLYQEGLPARGAERAEGHGQKARLCSHRPAPV